MEGNAEVELHSKPPAVGGITQVSDREFARFQALIYRETGIYLSPVKRTLLAGRLCKRLRTLNLACFKDYYELVENDLAEKEQMINCICTNETHFFREKRHFEFLESRVFPGWKALASEGRRSRCVRVWSAGCSTGEEPYSLAMFLLDHFSIGNWEIEVVASDISTRVLARAEAGMWPISKLAELPEHYVTRYMLKGTGKYAGLMKAGPELRSRIRFQRLNLNTDAYPYGRFDLVFCCNVLIYFNAESKKRVLDRMVGHLGPAGYLMLGHAETLNGITDRLRTVAPTIYTSYTNAAQNNVLKPRALGIASWAAPASLQCSERAP
jgi:chemotaxis protein methyltransferase CheR